MHLYNESLELSDAGVAKHNATIRFSVSYTQHEIRHPNTHINVQITLKGRDVKYDDELITFADKFNSNGQGVQSLEFHRIVADSELNEDIGRDEVYAEIVADGGTAFDKSNTVRTNIVRGRF
jgi:hypothetical protein